MKKNSTNPLAQRGRLAVLISLLVVACISGASFSFKLYSLDATAARLEEVERSLQNLKGAMHLDSVRQYQIQKVMKIIDQYNPGLDAELKYEIANEIYCMVLKYRNLDVDLVCAIWSHISGGVIEKSQHHIVVKQIEPASRLKLISAKTQMLPHRDFGTGPFPIPQADL